MATQNNESIDAMNSLSSIFKKPKPVLKAYRKKRNNENLSDSIELTLVSNRTNSQGKISSQQNSLKTLKNSVNFSGAYDSIDETVPANKKRRVPLQPRKSLKVSFSKSVNGCGEESLTAANKTGYLRQLRKNIKPSKDANFSAEIPTIDESRSTAKQNSANVSASKMGENISTPVLSLSFSPSWNSSPGNERRIRRCSTPLKGVSRSQMMNAAANLSLIPRALPFVDNELQSSSASAPNTPGKWPQNTRNSSLTRLPSTDSGSSAASSSSSASFVTRVFRREGGPNLDSDDEEPPLAVPSVKPAAPRTRKVDSDLRRKSVFPKLAPYCNKRFYDYFIYKMEPKYGIETKRRVVRFSQKVHALVQNIVSKKTNYQQLVHRLQTLLCRRDIIRTSYEFYWFSLKFLPRDAVIKIVPIIQPFGFPLLTDFDHQSVFEPIKME